MRSFIYMMTFLGPNTVPWGTPPLGFPTDDTVLPILTCCVLSRRMSSLGNVAKRLA